MSWRRASGLCRAGAWSTSTAAATSGRSIPAIGAPARGWPGSARRGSPCRDLSGRPGSTADRTVPTAADIAADVIADAGDPGLVTLAGDSAGGGLALAVAQTLRDRGIGAPSLLLIAPWLDATMTDPRIDPAATRDPVLSVPRLVRAGELYAGALPTSDPRVSPVNGSMAGLGPMTVLVGTRDLLVWDARRLHAAAVEAGVPIDYHEADGLIHVWPILPLPEARRVRPLLGQAVRGENHAGAPRPD